MHSTSIIFYAVLFFESFIAGVTLAQSNSLPQRIIVNSLEVEHRGVAVTWRCPLDVKKSFVQWRKADPHPVEANTLFEKKYVLSRKDIVIYQGDTTIFQSFRAQITDLNSGNKYLYRVGSDSAGWSEWIQFYLPAAEPDSIFTFIYMGDPQNDLYSQWSRNIRQVYSSAPQSSFILYAGDVVNRGYSDKEWEEWYRPDDFIHRMIPSIMTPDIHEYTDVVLTPLWRSQFSLPENGPKEVKELLGACYFVDYPALRVILLDGEQIDEDPEMRRNQLEWLEAVLNNTKQPWTVVALHYPFFSTRLNRDNHKLRAAFKPILDKYQVDLLLQDHDHGYGKGMVDLNVPSNSGTMYVVSVSGPNM